MSLTIDEPHRTATSGVLGTTRANVMFTDSTLYICGDAAVEGAIDALDDIHVPSGLVSCHA